MALNVRDPPSDKPITGEERPRLTWMDWFSYLAEVLRALTLSGTTAQRPTKMLWIGRPYWDTDIQTQVNLASADPNVWKGPPPVAIPTGTAHPQAPASGLMINIDGAGTRQWSADEIWLMDTSGVPVVLKAQFHNFNLADDLDVGTAMAANTWYYIFAIWDGTTVRTLLSASSKDPIMPAGYTHKGLMSAVRSDAAAAPLIMFAQGKRSDGANVTVLNNGTSMTITAVSVATAAPPIGRFVFGVMTVSATDLNVRAANISVDGTRGTQRTQDNAIQTTDVAGNFHVAYASSQVFYQNLALLNQTDIHISGWEF